MISSDQVFSTLKNFRSNDITLTKQVFSLLRHPHVTDWKESSDTENENIVERNSNEGDSDENMCIVNFTWH